MAWGKAGSTTLSSAGDTIDSGTISASKCNQSMIHTISSSSTNYNLQFNSDTGSNYAYRAEYNGGTDATRTSQSKCLGNEGSAVTTTAFHVSYIFSIPSEEKLSISHTARQETAGAGTAPNRQETVGKYVNTSAITGVQLTNSDSGSFDTDSNLTALGSDMTPAAAIPFPTNVQLGSRAEITDTRKMYNFSKLTFDFSASSSGAVSNQPTDATEVGQLITSTTHRGKKAKSATFYVKRTGSPSGTMVYKIRKSSDNSVVATSTGTSASALSTSTTAVTLDFNDEVIPSENIRVTVSGVTGSSGNIVTIYGGGADTVADQTLSVWGGSSWTEYGNDCAGKLTFTEEWQEIGA